MEERIGVHPAADAGGCVQTRIPSRRRMRPELASRIQDARMVTIAGGMVPVAGPDAAEFTRAALDFLDGL
jgi:hypothetical protein